MLTGGRLGIPSDWGGSGGPTPREALMMPPRYVDGGFGEVADDTEEESNDRVDKLGDRAKALCGGAAMIKHGHQDHRLGVEERGEIGVANLSGLLPNAAILLIRTLGARTCVCLPGRYYPRVLGQGLQSRRGGRKVSEQIRIRTPTRRGFPCPPF